jgi:hypothetical protein
MHENVKNYNNIQTTTFKLKEFYRLHSVAVEKKCFGTITKP